MTGGAWTGPQAAELNKGQTQPPEEQTCLVRDHFVFAGLPGQSRALRYGRLRCPQCGLSRGPSLLSADGAKDAIYPPLSHKHSHDLAKCFDLQGLFSGASSGPGPSCDVALPSLAGGQLSYACHAGNHVPGGLGHVGMCSDPALHRRGQAEASLAVRLGDTCSGDAS